MKNILSLQLHFTIHKVAELLRTKFISYFIEVRNEIKSDFFTGLSLSLFYDFSLKNFAENDGKNCPFLQVREAYIFFAAVTKKSMLDTSIAYLYRRLKTINLG